MTVSVHNPDEYMAASPQREAPRLCRGVNNRPTRLEADGLVR